MRKKPVTGFGGQRERYFILNKGILRYYVDQTKDSSKLKGSLKLTVCMIIAHIVIIESGHRQLLHFTSLADKQIHS